MAVDVDVAVSVPRDTGVFTVTVSSGRGDSTRGQCTRRRVAVVLVDEDSGGEDEDDCLVAVARAPRIRPPPPPPARCCRGKVRVSLVDSDDEEEEAGAAAGVAVTSTISTVIQSAPKMQCRPLFPILANPSDSAMQEAMATHAAATRSWARKRHSEDIGKRQADVRPTADAPSTLPAAPAAAKSVFARYVRALYCAIIKKDGAAIALDDGILAECAESARSEEADVRNVDVSTIADPRDVQLRPVDGSSVVPMDVLLDHLGVAVITVVTDLAYWVYAPPLAPPLGPRPGEGVSFEDDVQFTSWPPESHDSAEMSALEIGGMKIQRVIQVAMNQLDAALATTEPASIRRMVERWCANAPAAQHLVASWALWSEEEQDDTQPKRRNVGGAGGGSSDAKDSQLGVYANVTRRSLRVMENKETLRQHVLQLLQKGLSARGFALPVNASATSRAVMSIDAAFHATDAKAKSAPVPLVGTTGIHAVSGSGTDEGAATGGSGGDRRSDGPVIRDMASWIRTTSSLLVSAPGHDASQQQATLDLFLGLGFTGAGVLQATDASVDRGFARAVSMVSDTRVACVGEDRSSWALHSLVAERIEAALSFVFAQTAGTTQGDLLIGCARRHAQSCLVARGGHGKGDTYTYPPMVGGHAQRASKVLACVRFISQCVSPLSALTFSGADGPLNHELYAKPGSERKQRMLHLIKKCSAHASSTQSILDFGLSLQTPLKKEAGAYSLGPTTVPDGMNTQGTSGFSGFSRDDIEQLERHAEHRAYSSDYDAPPFTPQVGAVDFGFDDAVQLNPAGVDFFLDSLGVPTV